MKDNKRTIIIIIIVATICILYLLMAMLLNNKDIMATVRPTYLVGGNDFVWKKENGNWKDINDFSEINNIKFNIYYNSSSKRNGYIGFDRTNTYTKEDKDKSYKKRNVMIAISNGSLTLPTYEISDFIVGDNEFALSLLNNFYFNLNLFKGKEVNLDLDDNGVEDTLYLVSNLDENNTNGGVSKLFIVENNEIKQVLIDTGVYWYELKSIVDLDDDGKYEIILKKMVKTGEGAYDKCYELYSLVNGKYKAVKKCNI